MSEWNRTPEEYIERFANQHCDGDIEAAKEHEIVKEVCRELKEESDT